MVAVVTSLRHRPKVVTSTPSFDVDTEVVAVAVRAHGRGGSHAEGMDVWI
jgi:hypothetical protein